MSRDSTHVPAMRCLLVCLCLGCGSAEPIAETPVAVSDAENREPTTDTDADHREPTTDPDAENEEPTTDPDAENEEPTTDPDAEHRAAASDARPATPDDSVVPRRSIAVPLYGIAGCPRPERSSRVPRVDSSDWSFPGGAQLMVTARVIRREAHDELSDCYQGTEAHAACRNVTANVLLDVAPDGSVPRAVAAAAEADFARCVETALRDLTLPEPDGGGLVRLRFPLYFRVH